jgi:hypothetical protein
MWKVHAPLMVELRRGLAQPGVLGRGFGLPGLRLTMTRTLDVRLVEAAGVRMRFVSLPYPCPASSSTPRYDSDRFKVVNLGMSQKY